MQTSRRGQEFTVNDQVTTGTYQAIWPMNYATDHPMSNGQYSQQGIIPGYDYQINNQQRPIGQQYQVSVASQPVGQHYQASQLMEQQYHERAAP